MIDHTLHGGVRILQDLLHGDIPFGDERQRHVHPRILGISVSSRIIGILQDISDVFAVEHLIESFHRPVDDLLRHDVRSALEIRNRISQIAIHSIDDVLARSS